MRGSKIRTRRHPNRSTLILVTTTERGAEKTAPERAPSIQTLVAHTSVGGGHLDAFGVVQHVAADPLRLHAFGNVAEFHIQIHL